MSFKVGEIVSVLTKEIEDYRLQLESRETGRVLEVGDGIARVYGMSGVMSGRPEIGARRQSPGRKALRGS